MIQWGAPCWDLLSFDGRRTSNLLRRHRYSDQQPNNNSHLDRRKRWSAIAEFPYSNGEMYFVPQFDGEYYFVTDFVFVTKRSNFKQNTSQSNQASQMADFGWFWPISTDIWTDSRILDRQPNQASHMADWWTDLLEIRSDDKQDVKEGVSRELSPASKEFLENYPRTTTINIHTTTIDIHIFTPKLTHSLRKHE